MNPMIYLENGPPRLWRTTFTLAGLPRDVHVQNFHAKPRRRYVGCGRGHYLLRLLLSGNCRSSTRLMDYASVSPGGLSEMSGYADLSRFRSFGIYWGALALILAVLSIWMYRRGLQTGLFARLRRVGSAITVPTAGLAVLALAGFIGMGISIQGSYQDGEYRNKTQREKRAVAYEKLVKSHEDEPQPSITAVKADVEFYPDKREAVISGELAITNPHDEPLEQFFLQSAVGHEEDIRRMDVRGATRVTTGELAEGLEGL